MDGTTIPEKDFDLVLYGATGFVGSRAAAYLAKHPQQERLRWAIAGLDRNKLEQVKQQLGATATSVSVLVADSRDQDAVDAVVSRTRVLLNTAGPFALYGSSVVDACVRFQTHYVDITGETTWVRGLIDRYHDRDPVHPSFDRDLDTWVGPFIMGAINTRVVRRSAALFEQWGQPYSPHFHYQEYTKYNPPFARAKCAFVTGLMALYEAALDRSFSRNLLKPLLPKPGTGPSEQTMNSGWFTTELLGTSSDGQKVRGMIRFQGDPSNRATVCCVCESALSLVLNSEELPGSRERGGLLTPATGLGDVLVKRLREAGMSIEIDPSLVAQQHDLAVAAGT